MRRTLLALLLAVMALSITAPPPAKAHGAFEFTGGWFFNSAIADGRLNICYVGGTPVYNNRAALTNAVRSWGIAINLQIDSLGSCAGKTNWNIAVAWASNKDCYFGPAYTEAKFGGYSQIVITFNSHCGVNAFYWSEALPVTDGLYDAVTAMRHEAGHALGLQHENEPGHDPHNFSRDLMDEGAGGCFTGLRSQHSFTDVAAMQARYAGLSLGQNQSPQPAVCWN